MAHHFRETIARLELAERESRQAAQAKSRFLANMSHELRTPLNAILGYSEMLLEEAEEDSDDVERIHSAGEMLLGHIDALLDLSKIDAGRMDVYIERFDLAELIHETAAMMAPLVKQQSNRLVLELEPQLDCETDRTKVSQILNNLLTNANKFTQSGVLTVRAHRMAEHMRLEVEDTGIGIEHDVLPRLFDAFTQADSSTTKRYGGTGLGRALVREFAQLLDGSVMVDSTVGEGSTFVVTWRHGAVQES
jgi:signal transduction histidine kinase